MEMEADGSDLIRGTYGGRAATYDDARGGWHVQLAQDFVKWVDPRPGETVLDLACGTGLVTLAMAMRVGSKGQVTAVDLTPEMMHVGKEKVDSIRKSSAAEDVASISWIEADIASEKILGYPPIRQILDRDGGFDIISICSALVLLPNQKQSMQFWVEKLLKKGGRIIVDVPDESPTLQLLMSYHLPSAIGLPHSLAKGRIWIENQHSLGEMMKTAGLTIEQEIATKSYVQPVWYDSNETTALDVLVKQIKGGYPDIEKEGKSSEARQAWPEIWRKAVRKRPDGGEGVEDAHRLYVCVGRKV